MKKLLFIALIVLGHTSIKPLTKQTYCTTNSQCLVNGVQGYCVSGACQSAKAVARQ
ncbi:MAG: hypothetical protein P4L22_00880 [Candidatus Babeliales bacterium]|nr:hypothetical protein [Candidatus Babeliales bacterium]